MSKKAMISQPLAGKTAEEITATREKAISFLKEQGYTVVNTLFTDEWYNKDAMKERGVVQIPLAFMAKSLENMANCHTAYFAKGWESARGCTIEHAAAVAYGLEIIYEEPRRITNYERIKNMSVEEMAAYIASGISANPCDYCSIADTVPCNSTECDNRTNKEIIAEWLRREVSNND